jgi:O-antigen/teichoic acid export membrane protein
VSPTAIPKAGRLRTHLIKGAAGSFTLQIGFAGFSFLNAIILARVLGAGGYGAFVNAMSWVNLLTIPATFGFGILLVRDTAVYRLQAKWRLLNGLFRFSDRIVLVLSVVLALIFAVIARFVFSSPTEAIMRHTLWISLLMLPLFALYNLREAATRGLEYVIRARLPGMIVRPGLLLAGIVTIYYFYPKHLSAPMAMAVNVGAVTVTLGLGIFFLRQLLPAGAKTATPEYTPLPWLKAAFPMLVYGGAQIILGQTDVVMLGVMRGANEVGLYAVANRLAFLMTYVMTASNMILMPVMSRLYANGEKERLQKTLSRAIHISFFLALPVGLILIFSGKSILIVFGHGFTNAQPALAILAVGRLLDVSIGVGSGALVLIVAGAEKLVARIFLYASIMNVIMNMVLIPKYGISGAAIASVVALFLAEIVLVVNAFTGTGVYVAIGPNICRLMGLGERRK